LEPSHTASLGGGHTSPPHGRPRNVPPALVRRNGTAAGIVREEKT
jgi:hypothetical protein